MNKKNREWIAPLMMVLIVAVFFFFSFAKKPEYFEDASNNLSQNSYNDLSQNLKVSCDANFPFECDGECFSCGNEDYKLCCISARDNWCCPEESECDYVNKDCKNLNSTYYPPYYSGEIHLETSETIEPLDMVEIPEMPDLQDIELPSFLNAGSQTNLRGFS